MRPVYRRDWKPEAEPDEFLPLPIQPIKIVMQNENGAELHVGGVEQLLWSGAEQELFFIRGVSEGGAGECEIYADWLAENGHVRRSEGIRKAVKMAFWPALVAGAKDIIEQLTIEVLTDAWEVLPDGSRRMPLPVVE